MNNSAANPQSRSIFGPLVLIAFGALWLLNAQGVISMSNVWGVLRYWPVLLIALGIDALVRWRWPILANLVDLVFVALVVGAIIYAPRLGLAGGAAGWMSWMPFMMGATNGSGHIITETRDVSDFDSVAFASFGELTVVPGEREGLTIEAEDNVVREIRTEVRGRTLTIDFREKDGWAKVRPTQPVRFTLTVVDLEALDLSGAGNVVVNGLTADQLRATLSGAGNLSLVDLDTDDLNANLSGAGSMDAAGAAGHLDVLVSGLGSFRGANLESESVRVTLSGMGGATVWAVRQLNATMSGVGSVSYYGQPAVTKNVSGLGTVRSLGSK